MSYSGFSRSIGLGLTLLITACAAAAQKSAIESVMSNEESRRDSFEATLEIMDEHPEYVDELYAAAMRHPKTLDRFAQNMAKGLANEKLARLTARHLAGNPESVKVMMIAMLDEISDEPRTLAAVAAAMAERPQVAAMAVSGNEAATRAVLHAVIQEAQKNEHAARALLVAVRENSQPLAALIVNDPKVLESLLRAFAKVGVKKGQDKLDALIEAVAP